MAATEVLTEAFESERRGLVAHCYRMLGSWDEAEDVVQDTYLRALRGWDGFRREATTRTWLYRIATNACLTAVDWRGRRALPMGLGGPADDVNVDPRREGPGTWIQPFPTDPAAVVEERESLRLALIAGLQQLPAKQRAILLLREVLVFSAAEVAEMLDTTVPAVKSALQRARATLDTQKAVEPPTERQRELLEAYVTAFAASDLEALEKVLREDATLEMVPNRAWFSGRKNCLASAGSAMDGAWRYALVDVNGGPGFLAWWHDEPFGVAALTMAPDGIAAVHIFADPDLVRRWPAPTSTGAS
jgi:RNA polymerase sigma-70 factor (ECF subfamily)